MKIFIAICTLFIGVTIEYFVLFQPLNNWSQFWEVFFLFGIIVMPTLLLFVIPISLMIESITLESRHRILKSAVMHGFTGACAAIIILLVTLPAAMLTDLFHREYLFCVLNGIWFSLLFFTLDELMQKLLEWSGKEPSPVYHGSKRNRQS